MDVLGDGSCICMHQASVVVAQREARLCRQKKVAAMAYYTQKLIRH
jgi:hypothetical protein